MANVHGRFVWYELMTTDTQAAKNFYGKVVGWGTQDMPMPGMTYTMFTTGATPIGGLMDLPEDAKKMNTPPSWVGYIGVNDVDATTERFRKAGGSVYVEPRDIPNVGRFSVVASTSFTPTYPTQQGGVFIFLASSGRSISPPIGAAPVVNMV